MSDELHLPVTPELGYALRSAKPNGMLPGRVAGKSLLVVSAMGMGDVLISLWHGHVLWAVTMLLMTLFVLEILLQRAIAEFHMSRQAATLAYLPSGHESPVGS